jgi:hypothetical protein
MRNARRFVFIFSPRLPHGEIVFSAKVYGSLFLNKTIILQNFKVYRTKDRNPAIKSCTKSAPTRLLRNRALGWD